MINAGLLRIHQQSVESHISKARCGAAGLRGAATIKHGLTKILSRIENPTSQKGDVGHSALLPDDSRLRDGVLLFVFGFKRGGLMVG